MRRPPGPLRDPRLQHRPRDLPGERVRDVFSLALSMLGNPKPLPQDQFTYDSPDSLFANDASIVQPP
eukprot:5678883-Alexandrium_andersonii.AAC.1